MGKRIKKKSLLNSYLCLKLGIISEHEYKSILGIFQTSEQKY
jgi:hypothetical protein